MNNDDIVEAFNNEGVMLTDSLEESIYILSDGRLLSGMFDCGIRGVDHRIIESIFEDTDRNSTDFWDEVIKRTDLLMYIPETKTALKKQNQKLSEIQMKIVKKYNLKLEDF